ncbi:hypothetical protein A2721_01685 [Candidatus Gottesmanbacteria bacterium RIFCSPHIGHO2_01_FULL_47_48]|uniref:Antitoxin n=1 Tax=Candidatus Gottesmanbacteria bacterium RIFCSPHIGHO2_01_FULL_47_48 TaxID=1798381 RepID=A0A1F6A1C3_9BACT|nr:MAG: hypothetical protein A2721_01685 [Candidatus Gottesmanbacteria bacterium RIFCSPHIGHO2_01_FULL_47_48]
MVQSVPVRETRERLAELIAQVQVDGAQFVITRFGKPAAKLVPVDTSIVQRKRARKKSAIDSAFGIWKDRKDIKDSAEWVADVRRQWMNRNV